jgi:predicted HAD superfamily Cof-like phosphohydrolase
MYAQNHRAKNTPEARAKAEVNENLVCSIQAVLSQTEERNVLADTADFGRIAYADGISPKNQQTQLGVHFEEVSEMIETLKGCTPDTQYLLNNAEDALKDLADHLKIKEPGLVIITDRLNFLDSICDQLVTATLSAVLHGMDPVGGLHEVNRSNYSKLTNGVMEKAPVTAKWVKGPDYTPPDLTPFI